MHVCACEYVYVSLCVYMHIYDIITISQNNTVRYLLDEYWISMIVVIIEKLYFVFCHAIHIILYDFFLIYTAYQC